MAGILNFEVELNQVDSVGKPDDIPLHIDHGVRRDFSLNNEHPRRPSSANDNSDDGYSGLNRLEPFFAFI
jgi:hypothetical protein